MAYKNGKAYMSKRDDELRNAVKERNLNSILWVLLEDSLEDMEAGKEPRYGLDMLKQALQHLTSMQNKGGVKPVTETSSALSDFLKLGKKDKKSSKEKVEKELDVEDEE
jgi:hypothetical protein